MKQLFIVFLILICGSAFGATGTSMCVENDTVAVVLDASQNGSAKTSSSISSGTGTWNMTFSWGVVYGVAACLSQNYGNVVNEITDNGAVVIGAERNGVYCYCRMIHPAVSGWFYRGAGTSNNPVYSTAADCAGNCAAACVDYDRVYNTFGIQTNAYLRQLMLGSIAQ